MEEEGELRDSSKIGKNTTSKFSVAGLDSAVRLI